MFTIGCDPEIFVTKRGKGVSAYGLVKGTKEKPERTTVGAVQVDGVALEINIDPVGYNDFKSFNQNILRTLRDLREKVSKDFSFSIRPVMDFTKDQMDAWTPEERHLGCEPDFDAYNEGKENPKPNEETPFRTGAGHIHIGWGKDIPYKDPEHIKICCEIVKLLDLTVGAYCKELETDKRRSELYGKFGAFRPKPYGVEYRSPSNVWLKSEKTRKDVFLLTRYTLDWAKTYGTNEESFHEAFSYFGGRKLHETVLLQAYSKYRY